MMKKCQRRGSPSKDTNADYVEKIAIDEQVLAEKNARILELSSALVYEREQARFHAETYAQAQAALTHSIQELAALRATAPQPAPHPEPANNLLSNTIAGANGNILAQAAFASIPLVLSVSSHFSFSLKVMVTYAIVAVGVKRWREKLSTKKIRPPVFYWLVYADSFFGFFIGLYMLWLSQTPAYRHWEVFYLLTGIFSVGMNGYTFVSMARVFRLGKKKPANNSRTLSHTQAN